MIDNKVKINKLYRIPSGAAVRVIRIENNSSVIAHNYHSHSNEFFNYDEFEKISTQLFKISDVAKILGKKASTIRKYENDGLIPKAPKISLNIEGKITTRVYTSEDIENLILFFQRRKRAGRPNSRKISGSARDTI